MALPDWTNGNGTNLWSDGANWSTAVKPQAGDTVTFTNTSVANCTVDEVTAEIASLTIGGTSSGVYSGTITIDNKLQTTGNFNIESGCTATVDVNADLDIDGTFNTDGTGSTMLCGSGTWTIGGDFNNEDAGSWNRETSTIKMVGNGTNLIGRNTKNLFNLTISANVTLSSATATAVNYSGDFTLDDGFTFTLNDGLRSIGTGNDSFINGTLLVNAGITWELNVAGTITIGTAGLVTGLGSCVLRQPTIINNRTSGTSWDVATTTCRNLLSISEGTYGGDWTFEKFLTGARTLTFGNSASDALTFTGSVTINADASGEYTIKMDTYNPLMTFEGDLILNESVGTISWLKGNVVTTFSGTTIYDDGTVAIQNIGDVVVSGALDLTSDMDCDDFTGTGSGSLTLDNRIVDATGDMDWQSGFTVSITQAGASFVVGNNWTANAQDLSGVAVAWTLKVSGATAVASGAGAVANSDASGFTEINASAVPWTDSGGNTNWNFGAVGFVPYPHVPGMTGGIAV